MECLFVPRPKLDGPGEELSHQGRLEMLMKPRSLLCGLLLVCLPLPTAQAQQKKEVPAGTPVTIIVKPAEPAGPAITLKPNGREAKAVPLRCGCAKTGGGNIDVQLPSPDTLVITVTGVAVATGHPCKKSN